ncbi:MAG: twin-arginine translocase TatA/TatE family subunit [Kiritimatiellae bacterium]|nr:twin-arginine translocase TatA/TatE family subunit [Kiritimatiellia bacterium]
MLLAFLLDSAGFGEWFVLLAVVLIVVGPRRLPETARKLGGIYSRFRRAADNFKRELLDMDTKVSSFVEAAEKEAEESFSDDDDSGSGENLTDDGETFSDADEPFRDDDEYVSGEEDQSQSEDAGEDESLRKKSGDSPAPED